MLPISVCIIAKNEEKYIGECLRRLTAYDWEIIVVDTGSTDRTIEIALEFTQNVFQFDWINDFSAARNYSISKASNDYILSVDCDEFLERDEMTDHLIRHLTEQITPSQIGVLNLFSPSADLAASTANTITIETAQPVVHEHIARFFHRKHTHYQGTIHEQLTSINGDPLEFIPIPLSFYHTGYSTIDIKKEKAFRNISMLDAELQRNGDDPYILFQLGQSYFGLSDHVRALPYFERALSMDVNEQEEYVQTLVESYGYCLLYLKQYDKALELEGIYSIFSKRADFVFLMGLIYMNNALFDKAIAEFLKATTITDYSVDGVNSYLSFYNVGVIYECMQNVKEAVKYYEKCGNYEPAVKRKNTIHILHPITED